VFVDPKLKARVWQTFCLLKPGFEKGPGFCIPLIMPLNFRAKLVHNVDHWSHGVGLLVLKTPHTQ